MNTERLKTVREHIDNHRNRFIYSSFFAGNEPIYDGQGRCMSIYDCTLDYIENCGTAACVAGWTILLFGDKTVPLYRINESRFAKDALDLTSPECQFLFYYKSEEASVDDALARLDWLIAGNNVLDYDFGKESWVEAYKWSREAAKEVGRKELVRFTHLETELEKIENDTH